MQTFLIVLIGYIMPILDQVTISLLLGAATFGLIFYFKSNKDGHIDEKEKDTLTVIAQVLRASTLGQIAIQGVTIAVGLYAYKMSPESYQALSISDFYVPILLATIIFVAVLIKYKEIGKDLAPAIAGASWYGYFFARNLQADLSTLSVVQFVAIAALWGCAFVLGFDYIKQVYWKRKNK